jgi:hypothetical protein
MSTLERICAQCQEKDAHFEIVHIIHFNFYKTATSTHAHSLYSFEQQHIIHPSLPLLFVEVCNIVQLHVNLQHYIHFTLEKCISIKDKI